ncbi:MAG: hypothetical protein KDC99_19685 [Cyclobacteriaceae bacterium]|nr:hypothetical protein [Cyclobacteriaceae bacterium]
MEAIKAFLELVGLITTLIAVLAFFSAVISGILGISPLLYRLGLGRWRRKITVLADSDNFASIRDDLVSSGVFRAKNIDHVTSKGLAKVKESNLLLVDYGSFTDKNMKTIIRNKKSSAGMVVYFPDFSPTNRVPDDVMKLINDEPHSVLVNFRGRLINDILITLLSTSYDKR